MHIHESKFLEQHVNSALGLVLIAVMCLWTVMYYFNNRIERATANIADLRVGSEY